MEKKNNNKYFIKFVLLLTPIILFLISVSLGRYKIGLIEFFQVMKIKILKLNKSYPKVVDTVIFNVRIPRILAAMMVGASLSVSGAVYQGMFKNPMVSPSILGTSAGAGFGAALGILLSYGRLGTQVSSFIFGLLAVFITYTISKLISKDNGFMFVLILSGMLVGTVFQSFISITKYLADPNKKLPAITFWLMGSLAGINKKDVLFIVLPFILGIIPLFLIAWKINVLSFGEEEAKALGINVRLVRGIVIFSSTLLTAASISISGMIGWVGLIVPHMARLIVGPDFKYLIPASALIGSSYLLLVDNIARTISPIEIPLGILTSLVGAPFFIYLLFKTREGIG